MHRFYMNAETRDALIAESKRLIAARSVGATARDDATSTADDDWPQTKPLDLDEGVQLEDAGVGSVFAALVSDLEWASAPDKLMPPWLREPSLSRS